MITNDEIRLLWIRAPNEDVGFGESRGPQANRSSLGNRSGSARGETGLDFDKFFVDVVCELSLYFGPCNLSADGTSVEDQDEDQVKQARFFHFRHASISPRGCAFIQLRGATTLE